MAHGLIYAPPDEAIDNSLEARKYLQFLASRMKTTQVPFPEAGETLTIDSDIDSVGVLTGLSSLRKSSGYMEMDIDSIFEPEGVIRQVRKNVSPSRLIVAVVDDVYSEYLMKDYLRCGASAVVGTGGDLFGMVTSRIDDVDHLLPYINAYARL